MVVFVSVLLVLKTKIRSTCIFTVVNTEKLSKLSTLTILIFQLQCNRLSRCIRYIRKFTAIYPPVKSLDFQAYCEL